MKPTKTNQYNVQAEGNPFAKAITTCIFVIATMTVYAQLPDSAILKDNFTRRLRSVTPIPDSITFKVKWPHPALPKLDLRRPLQIEGGNISYQYDYRSNIDTPFLDKNISQHYLNGQLNVTAFKAIPLTITFLVRETNSSIFRDIHDVRVDFNAIQYAQSTWNNYRRQLTASMPGIRDSLQNTIRELTRLSAIPVNVDRVNLQQKLVECNEILNIPAIAESIAGPEKADSVKQKALEFIEAYKEIGVSAGRYKEQLDSLQNILNSIIAKGKAIDAALKGDFGNVLSPSQLIELLRKENVKLPAGIKHLLALRRLSVGRSQLNYSELTARNINLNGINIEYNSGIYFALAAGTVDYRFRDFILSRTNRQPQYYYLARIGIGRLENNFIILSAYKGRKQFFLQQNSSTGPRSLNIYGISAEAKYRINKNSYVIGEVAESASSGLNYYDLPKSPSLFSWNDKTNKAYSFKLYSSFPKLQARVEAMYRYTGAFFQSFDRFQSNSQQQYWYIKAEKQFWKKQLRIAASIRNNEYTNPYIVQQYSSNMIFKSLQVTFRKRKWPVLSAGYMPSSQLTKIDGQLTENRFHTLNLIGYHQYKIGGQSLMSTVTYNRFYNNAADTSFLYFNAVNFYMQHLLFFRHFTAGIGATHTRNPGFELNVLEESLQFTIRKNINLSAGIKINNYNRMETKVGSWMRLSGRVMKAGWVQLYFDNGFIPSNNAKLVRNQLLTVSINKTF